MELPERGSRPKWLREFLASDSKIIAVANRLPLEPTFDEHGELVGLQRTRRSPLESSLTRIQSMGKEVVTVGRFRLSRLGGASADAWLPKCRELGCEPVFIDDELAHLHFDGFCKQVLWPLFHYELKESRQLFCPKLFDAYIQFNKAFAERIADVYSEGDLVWIHDYHLLVLPHELRIRLGPKEGPKMKIGLFLHIPFPASELFKTLPYRQTLLNGMCGADLVGFQTYAYARHFLSGVSRILELDVNPRSVLATEPHFHQVELGVFPSGVEIEEIEQLLATPEVQARIEEMRVRFGDKKVVVARDQLDKIKAIPNKLRIFEAFLDQFPEHAHHTCLLQLISLPHNCNFLPKKHPLATELSEIFRLAGHINGKWSTIEHTPVHIVYADLPLELEVASYAIADVGLWTPLRDGMGVSCHAFVACQEKRHAPLVLSEFAGSASALAGAYLVNPWNVPKCAEALKKVLNIPEEERSTRWKLNRTLLPRYSPIQWLRNFMCELLFPPKSIHGKAAPRLNTDECVAAFASAPTRTLLLDYEGTLSITRKLSPTMLAALRKLSQDPNTNVVVLSGQSKDILEEVFGDLEISLSAEVGAFERAASSSTWRSYLFSPTPAWFPVVLPLLTAFTRSTPGSEMQVRSCSVVWTTHSAAPHDASFKQADLLLALKDLSENLPIEVVPIKEGIQIYATGVTKGTSTRRFLDEQQPSFVLAVGDDAVDEDIFRSINPEHHDSVFTVRVGVYPTCASNAVKSHVTVEKLIHALSESL